MTDTPRSNRHRPHFVPIITLGTVVSLLGIMSATIGVTLYAGTIKADGQVIATRVSALEQVNLTRRADEAAARMELLTRLNRMEDTLNDIRRTQSTRMPPP